MWDIIITLLCIFISIYLWVTWNYDYWKKRGIPYIEPTFFFGNLKDLILMRKHLGEVYADFYWKYPNEPAVGIFKMLWPQLVLRDIDLIKTVLVKEFSSFHDNEFFADIDNDPLIAYNPFLAKGEKWKALRTFHSQNQSSGKIKGMFTLMLEVCQDMTQFLKEKGSQPIEAKYFCGQYTTDVVSSSIYGLKSNSFLDPNAEFRKMSSRLFERTWMFNVLFTLNSIFPSFSKLFKLSFIPKDVSNFFIKAVNDLCDYRIKNKVRRNDFVQTMLDENEKSDVPKYTPRDIAAHSMTFFLDGYETSSTLMAYVLYLLALYPEHQERIRDEINAAEKLDYEDIHKFKYLDAFINETLRLYPPGLALTKVCTKDITMSAGDRTYPLTKGVTVAIPVFPMHRDPSVFQDPEVFDPNRFYEKQAPQQFVPFGMGPRACLGSRFALTQVKTGLSHLIKHFRIQPKDSNGVKKLPGIDDTSAFLMPPKSGLWVKFEEIK
ncbi:hypothetical protein O3M35_010533 [Rhynocoris fuscipes]|uniref:Cytochrome P450 n=1 Tax=Rhynocoris fuscipes TaxID=488301 RepID=A0AAW1D2Y0_9HEMI